MRVKAFFIITGFLVSYSFLSRNGDCKHYAIKRVVRILPAYVAVICFAVIIGAVFSKESFLGFFTQPHTWKYFLANLFMLNFIEPSLPMLFQFNHMTAVNGSLWSMKFEVLFYCMVPFVFWLITKINKHIFTLITIAVVIAVNIWSDAPIHLNYFCYFFTGMIAFWEFPFLHRIMWPALITSSFLLLTPHFVHVDWWCRLIQILYPFLFTITLLTVAYSIKFLSFFRHLPNVTYGIYLYHFPIIQVLLSLGLAQYNVWLCLCIAMLLTFTMANLSWFLIEKPLMDKYK